MKEEKIQIDGVVKAALPNATFKVEIEGGHIVTAQISGKIRTHFIRIMPGDLVTVEVSTYDVHRGRIIYRKGRARNETNQ